MSTRAFYHPRGIVVDLAASLELWLYNEIASHHGCRDKANPVLTCLGNNEPMYVYRHESGRYFVRHYPNGNRDGHAHKALQTMSVEHRHQAEYAARAAQRHGLTAELEVSTGNHTRLDVGVVGPNGKAGLEIQRSQLTAPQAVRRACNSFEAGWATAWVSDQERAPSWANRVPTAMLTTRGGWDRMPKPDTAYVSIGRYVRERDKSRPSGWWYRREPMAVLLDDLSYRMPAGEIVPVAHGTKGLVSLAESSAVEVIDSCTYVGASQWNPVVNPANPHKEVVQRYSRDCHHSQGQESSPLAVAYAEYPPCPLCNGRLYWPESQARGWCNACDYSYRHNGPYAAAVVAFIKARNS